MQITLAPVLDYAPLRLRRNGDTLMINRGVLELAAIPEGATLPEEAVECLALVPGSVITRIGGVLHLSLRRPYPGGMAPDAQTLTLADQASADFGLIDEEQEPGEWHMIAIDMSQLVTAEQATATALADARARARARLASYISEARTAVITILPGQDMIYQAKEAEARSWIADPAPDLAGYPLLTAEIGITAPDPEQLAQLWLNMANLWRQQAAQLEALRLGIGAQIDAAGTVEGIEAAVAHLVSTGL